MPVERGGAPARLPWRRRSLHASRPDLRFDLIATQRGGMTWHLLGAETEQLGKGIYTDATDPYFCVHFSVEDGFGQVKRRLTLTQRKQTEVPHPLLSAAPLFPFERSTTYLRG